MRFSDLSKYRYDLPPELIRKEGVEPRDSARLFIYDTRTDTVSFDTFAHLAQYLPERPLIVLNDTKVLPARLWLKKETGGKIEVFVLANQIEDEHRIPVLVDRKTAIGQKLFFPNMDHFEVVGQDENIFFLELHTAGDRTLADLLDLYGETPLPHYLEGAGTEESVLRQRYQTIFAAAGASVAAPTASLHFTESVLRSLDEKGAEFAKVTLNVGLGTFAPLSEKSFEEGRLHAEHISVSEAAADRINAARDAGRGIVAVGTTAARTLESAAGDDGRIVPYAGKTDIFIYPPYRFRSVDHLITNFHLPETSLMLLVDAFLEHKGAKRRIMDLYAIAIEEKFAFYSFGDSMLIL